MENIAVEKVKIWLSSVFSDIVSSSQSVINLCQEVSDAMGDFNCLIECSLFESGIASIKNMSQNIINNINSFNDSINHHSEDIVDIETYLKTFFENSEDFVVNSDFVINVNAEAQTLDLMNGETVISTLNVSDLLNQKENMDNINVDMEVQENSQVDSFVPLEEEKNDGIRPDVSATLLGGSIAGVAGGMAAAVNINFNESQVAQESQQLAQTEEQNSSVNGAFVGSSQLKSDLPNEQEFTSVNNGQSITGANKENIEFITQKYKEQQAAQESQQLAQTEEQKNQLHGDLIGESNGQNSGTGLQQSTPNQNLNSGLGSSSSSNSNSGSSSGNNNYIDNSNNNSYENNNQKPTFSYPSRPEFNNGFIKDENQNIGNDNVVDDVPTIDKEENNIVDNPVIDDSFIGNSTPIVDNSANSNINNNINTNNNIGNVVPNENVIGNNSNTTQVVNPVIPNTNHSNNNYQSNNNQFVDIENSVSNEITDNEFINNDEIIEDKFDEEFNNNLNDTIITPEYSDKNETNSNVDNVIQDNKFDNETQEIEKKDKSFNIGGILAGGALAAGALGAAKIIKDSSRKDDMDDGD